MVDLLLQAAELLGPLVAGLLTVPVLGALKRVAGFIDRTPAAVQQLLGVVVAYVLTQLGTALDVVLPGELSLFTGESTEVLLAAAIAFGVHAGKKARGTATALLVLLTLLPRPAAAQVAVDSVEVQIYAPGDILVAIAPRSFTGLVGDTVQFSAVAVDAPTGDTIPALLRWSTPNPEAVSIDPMTGEAVFLSRGRWRIRVEVERVGGLVLMEYRDGVLRGADHVQLTVGESTQLCAYLLNTRSQILVRSPSFCPDVGIPSEMQVRLPFGPVLERWGHLRVG